MKYKVTSNSIEIERKDDFVAKDILECGQIFAFIKTSTSYVVFSRDYKAEIVENKNGYKIFTDNPAYFENFFDLKTDYGKIKKILSGYEILKKPIEFGKGIRILKQDMFETLISFIISANNNIKRIQLILFRLREKLGEKKDGYFAFPTQQKLLEVDENFFKEIGAGYRASYLYKVLRQVDENTLEEWRSLPTQTLRNKLIALSGVGPKVADCVLLFGYGKQDVFPVDTWIEKMYCKFYKPLSNREKIRENLLSEFKNLSGYAQQYLFFSMREGENQNFSFTFKI